MTGRTNIHVECQVVPQGHFVLSGHLAPDFDQEAQRPGVVVTELVPLETSSIGSGLSVTFG